MINKSELCCRLAKFFEVLTEVCYMYKRKGGLGLKNSLIPSISKIVKYYFIKIYHFSPKLKNLNI